MSLEREEGAGKAGCPEHPQPVCIGRWHTVVTTVAPEVTRLSPRNGFNGLYVLFSATNSFLSPSLNGLMATSPGWAGFASAQLDISNGCQNHTTSPYAATSTKRFDPPCAAGRSSGRGVEAPFVCAPADRSQRDAALRSPVARQRCCVHRISSRVRDDSRSAPRSGETGRVKPVICPTAEGGIFFARGLDRFLPDGC